MHSATTQPNLDQQTLMAHQNAYTEQWTANERAQSRDLGPSMQPMSAGGDMMLRPTSQMHTTQSFSMDPGMNPGMHGAVGSAMVYQQHPGLHHHAVASESFGANASFTDADSQILDRDDADDADSIAGPPAKSKGSRTSANNELEMRQLFQSNRNRTLGDVAKDLHGNERGPNSERARQIFAMLWINGACHKGKGSVPRGRVYANYALRCSTERITVLNPASFGKLVRVLFPAVRIRRLGVRGESKYHYVNFTLIDDQPELRDESVPPTLPLAEPFSFAQPDNSTQSQSPALNASHSALPSPTLPQQPDTRAGLQSAATRAQAVYNDPDVQSLHQLQSSNAKTMQVWSFPDAKSQNPEAPLVLPKIEPFLPNGTDPDAAKSLVALYQSHCTSIVECIRHCKEKYFFHLYTSFQGTLTMPVQKLFANPSIAPWIEQCDIVLYQRLALIVHRLTLQVMPPKVLDTLRTIAERIVTHIRHSYHGQPAHVQQAKEAPAALFAGLIDRALRVNLTAHAAANVLAKSGDRDQMYLDWVNMVRIRKIAEWVPAGAMDDLVNMFVLEFRDLINPVDVPWEVESRTLYGEVVERNRGIPHAPCSTDGNENVLDRWINFLLSLPNRFPQAAAHDIVSGVLLAGLEVMRDLTISQAKSFGLWWVVKCFIDEFVTFQANYGGFMKQRRATSYEVPGVPKHSVPVNNAAQPPQPQPDRAPFPSQLEANGQDPMHPSANHDDSGIGIRTPEEDFPMDKFTFPQGDGQSLQSLGL